MYDILMTWHCNVCVLRVLSGQVADHVLHVRHGRVWRHEQDGHWTDVQVRKIQSAYSWNSKRRSGLWSFLRSLRADACHVLFEFRSMCQQNRVFFSSCHLSEFLETIRYSMSVSLSVCFSVCLPACLSV